MYLIIKGYNSRMARWRRCIEQGKACGNGHGVSMCPLDLPFSEDFCVFAVVQSLGYVWLCDPMNRSTPGLPVHHQLPEFTQTHVHWVHDAIQPSHPLLSPSPPAFNLSQPQGLFHWVLHIRRSKCWIFSFSISPSNEYPGLISFTLD